MTQRRGEYTPPGRLRMGDLRTMVRNADRLAYPDEAPVDIHTPMIGDRRRVTLTVIDGDTDQLSDYPPSMETPQLPTEFEGEDANGRSEDEAEGSAVR